MDSERFKFLYMEIILKMMRLMVLVIPVLGVYTPALGSENPSNGLKIPTLSLDLKQTDDPEDFVPAIKIVMGLTILSVAPAILLMMTSFTRIIVVLSFVRQAMGTVNMPPNQVMIGLAMFLTYYTMSPVFEEIKTTAYDPYIAKHISQEQAIDASLIPLKKFMMRQTRETDLILFASLSKATEAQLKSDPSPGNILSRTNIPLSTVIPSFIVSELKTAFQIGFLIYIPFLVIDMVISSVLMAMGMVMLPPVIISLPFKLILFVLVDGWALISENLVKSFNG